MAANRILMTCGDYSEDYETMAPFQALRAVGFGIEAATGRELSHRLVDTPQAHAYKLTQETFLRP